jgi:hypothetical protein
MSYKVNGVIPCAICGADSIGRKLCRNHYVQMRNKGRLDEFPILGPSDVFENRILKTDTCWLWKGTRHQYGYGIFLMPGEKPVRAHRYSYEYFVGPIPEGKIILHLCDNPPCVNPAHLRLGTKRDNAMDKISKERHWRGKLSDSDIDAIIASDKRQSELAKIYEVDQSHISRIKRGLAVRYK